MKLPSGPGAPAADAGDALAQATAVCHGVRTLSAEVGASGKVSGQRFRARLLVGVAAPASARIEAAAPFGPPFFILAAVDDAATLLLPRDMRVLQHRSSAEVLEAVAGVPLSATDLRLALTGCAPEVLRPEGVALGPDWRVIKEAGRDALYLHRSGGTQPWQLVAALRPPGRIEFRDRLNGLPRSIRLTSDSTATSGPQFDVTLVLSQVETNVTLGAEVFHVDLPPAARPITLDELRHARPGVREN